MKYIVMAVPARAANVEYLKTHIPGLEVVWEQGRGAMDTFLRSNVAGFGGPSVRLEDDVCLTKNFMAKIEAAIALHPFHVIQFFSRSKYDISIGSRYKSGGAWSSNCCFYLPQGTAEHIVEFYNSREWRAQKSKHPTGLDTIMASMFSLQRREFWVHVPSLVQHGSGVSAIGPARSRFRQSATFENPELRGYLCEK